MRGCFLQEKARLKKEKDEAEAKYKVAYVDGKEEPVRRQSGHELGK